MSFLRSFVVLGARTVAVAVLAAILNAAACGAALADTVTLRMWTFLNPSGSTGRERALAQLIKDFETANPGTKVQVEQQVWDQMTPKFLAAHAARSAPDLIWVNSDLLGKAIDAGSLADISAAFTGEDMKDLDNSLVRAARNGPALYAVGQSYTIMGILARADYLAAKGVDPKRIATWSDLDEAAKALTITANGATTRWGFCQHFGLTKIDPGIVLAYLLTGGSPAFDASGTAHWANEQGVQGIKRAAELLKAGYSPKEGVTWNNDDMYDQFSAGRCAMATGTSVRIPNLQAASGDSNIAFIPYPSDTPGKVSNQAMNAWMTGVWSGSKNKALAAKFVAFMASPAADRLWVTEGSTVPIRSSTLPALTDFFAQPKYQFLGSAMQYVQAAGWIPPLSADISGYRDDLNRAVQRVVLNGAAPLDSLKEAEKAYNTRHGQR